MRDDVKQRMWHGFGQLRGVLRRPEIMAFLPAITLASFWFGGEEVLILTALGMPLLFALVGAFRFHADEGAFPNGLAGLSSTVQLNRALGQAMAQRVSAGETTGALVFTLDDYDDLYARHGAAALAEIQDRIADRLMSALRGPDVMARMGQGSFGIALTPMRRLDLESMVQIAARLQAAASPPISIDATRLYVTGSVGFCLASRAPEPDAASVFGAATAAVAEALRHGPGAIRAFAPDIGARHAQQTSLRDALEVAFAEGQIKPHFQPQVSTDTGALTGFEALARWHHPERGLIPPAEFLPAVMDAGLSSRLCDTILTGALAAMRKWDQIGLNVPKVGVNFSCAELRDPRLVDRIKWELDRFDLKPQRLAVEILETVVADTSNDIIVRNLSALSRLGCALDLDDFGTGQAAIANIRRFSVNRIKIDRSFVTRVHDDREQQRTVAAILSLAEQLGLDTLAEGVETPEEHAMLAQLGCRHIQGYVIARPMPFEDTADWIGRHRAQAKAIRRIGSRAG
jgi:diguanylate cyclase